MKTVRNIIFVFTILAVVGCKNKPVKKDFENQGTKKILPKNIAVAKPLKKTEQIELIPCKYIVKEILTTSPRYRQLTKGLNEAVIKNGGLSFGVNLEGSPNPKQDTVCCYSSNYDFTIFESYTDRQLSTARFSFNPDNKQLYEYDAVHDKLKPIEFDKRLLAKYNASCN